MKRFVIALLLTAFVVALMSSCKSKDCPAYGQVETQQTEQNG